MLYLDTARLGLMTTGAQAAHQDFVRLAAAEGGSALFERFLRWGLQACGARVGSRYPGLASWQGVAALKDRVRLLAGGCAGLPVLLASRSAVLMRLAAQLLCHPCRQILVTDLGWPPVPGPPSSGVPPGRPGPDPGLSAGRRSERPAHRRGGDRSHPPDVSPRALRRPLPDRGQPPGHSPACRSDREGRGGCGGGPLRGHRCAQEFGHLPGDLGRNCCDFYLTGVHKWFRAYNPLGLAFYGRMRSQQFIQTMVAEELRSRQLDDPLLRFSTQLETGALDGVTETVNLGPLFSCQGATDEALGHSEGPHFSLPMRQIHRRRISALALRSGWRPLVPCSSLQTGILLLQPAALGGPATSSRRGANNLLWSGRSSHGLRRGIDPPFPARDPVAASRHRPSRGRPPIPGLIAHSPVSS